MHHIIKIFILVFVIGCSNKISHDNNISFESLWKYEWLNIYFKSNSNYDRDILNICFDKNRDKYFDMERKIRAINNTKIGDIKNCAKDYLTKNKIKFDSLKLITSYSPFNDDEYSSNGPTNNIFYVVYSNEIKHKFIIELDEGKCIIEQIENDSNLKINYQNSGCGYGFQTITTFNKDWNWNINNISINPDSTM